MGFAHMGTGNFGHGAMGFEAAGFEPMGQGLQAEQAQAGDALEVYFECITTCSLDDGACVTRCVEQLREQP
ncbi:hypothetical protein KBY71_05830 [Cyanobium sp. T1B-Tous]|uniref:hypothetical protein n=1 Tax=Cyanobium sp. T1B-Tous TaxID=2823721 RepID=UPI0020CE580D|nr:hypothetical protein [Cyanobium sp. T1B-Tous]MCP9806036.1 hypothetical protein [Cyanobium sp. T1B-Tous]